MDFLQPSPTAKPTLPCSTDGSPSKFKGFKNGSSNTRKPSNEPPKGTQSMMGASPTSTFPAATGSLARPSGSSSMTMVPHRASPIPMAPVLCHTSSTCMWRPMTSTMKRVKQNPLSPYQHGSASLWWAPQLILPYFIMLSLLMTIGDSPERSTATTTSIANSLIPVSSSNSYRLTLMPSNRLGPPASPTSSSHAPLNKLRNSKGYHIRPRPHVARGSVRLLDVVVQSSGRVMLLALRLPARSDLPRLM